MHIFADEKTKRYVETAFRFSPRVYGRGDTSIPLV